MTGGVVLVAFGVVGDTEEARQRRLMEFLPGLQHDGVYEYWIAEDERYDRSDNDSAVFIPGERSQPGTLSQTTAFALLQEVTSIRRAAIVASEMKDEQPWGS